MPITVVPPPDPAPPDPPIGAYLAPARGRPRSRPPAAGQGHAPLHGLDEVAATQPALSATLDDLLAAAWTGETLPAGVLALCRARIGVLLGSGPSGLSDIDHRKAAALSRWPDAAVFDDVERACLAVAEQLVLDAQGLTAALVRPVVDLVGERGYTALVVACALAEGVVRAGAVLGTARSTGSHAAREGLATVDAHAAHETADAPTQR